MQWQMRSPAASGVTCPKSANHLLARRVRAAPLFDPRTEVHDLERQRGQPRPPRAVLLDWLACIST